MTPRERAEALRHWEGSLTDAIERAIIAAEHEAREMALDALKKEHLNCVRWGVDCPHHHALHDYDSAIASRPDGER